MEPKSIVSANSTTGAYFAPGGRGSILSYRKNLVNSGHGMRPPQMGCGGRWERISSIRPSGFHLCLRILAGLHFRDQPLRVGQAVDDADAHCLVSNGQLRRADAVCAAQAE